VVNKGGAGGLVGIQSAAVSKPDGYTLMVALSSVPYLHEVDTLFNRPKAYTPDHFIPLAMLTADPLVIAVHSDSPWKTVEDFVADAKKRPGAVKLGSAIYSVMHVGAELFFQRRHPADSHSLYRGGPTLNALLGKHVDCAAGPNVIVAQMKAGTVRPWSCWAKSARPMPNTPTAREGVDAEFTLVALSPSGHFGTRDQVLRDAIREAVKPHLLTRWKRWRHLSNIWTSPNSWRWMKTVRPGGPGIERCSRGGAFMSLIGTGHQ
jgi:tripartite-type tricarboxylate transporter receptor subunit TctC